MWRMTNSSNIDCYEKTGKGRIPAVARYDEPVYIGLF